MLTARLRKCAKFVAGWLVLREIRFQLAAMIEY